ncbi:MAG: response regulator transcription factor [Planctomycetia bacterium]|nr:response regulator transcription factor [Planctomycetia bacterium]
MVEFSFGNNNTNYFPLLLIDEQEIFCMGVKALLEGTEFRVVNEFRSVRSVQDNLKVYRPKVLLIGVSYYRQREGLDKIYMIRRKYPRLPIIVALPTENPVYAQDMLACGATGYYYKSSASGKLLQILRDVCLGRGNHQKKMAMVYPDIGKLGKFSYEKKILTERESEVLLLIMQGIKNKEISRQMGVSVETVKEYVHNVLRKLHVKNRTQAAVLAIKIGFGTG